MESSILTPALFIHQGNLSKLPLIELEGNNRSENSLQWWEKKIKDAVGYPYVNSHIFLQTTLLGHYFRFSVYADTRVWQITVWDMSGSNTVGVYQFDIVSKETDIISPDLFKTIINDCEDFIRGIQTCSHCKTKIKKEDIAGQYFAGRYCKPCWDSKYKAIEAAETYE